MSRSAIVVAALITCAMPAFAATDYPSAMMHTALPSEAMTVTDWYKQNVYDPNENKIGDIKDVLVDKSGKVVALIVGVGGFLGAGEKDVAVPFEAVHPTMKDKKWWLVMNTTKDSLKSAPGFKYDSNTTPGCLIGPNWLLDQWGPGNGALFHCLSSNVVTLQRRVSLC
jgi:sporulation protein YlmC with PRC-barrel domain